MSDPKPDEVMTVEGEDIARKLREIIACAEEGFATGRLEREIVDEVVALRRVRRDLPAVGPSRADARKHRHLLSEIAGDDSDGTSGDVRAAVAWALDEIDRIDALHERTVNDLDARAREIQDIDDHVHREPGDHTTLVAVQRFVATQTGALRAELEAANKRCAELQEQHTLDTTHAVHVIGEMKAERDQARQRLGEVQEQLNEERRRFREMVAKKLAIGSDYARKCDEFAAETRRASDLAQQLAEERLLSELAWGLIANAGEGNWERESDEWRKAAEHWREKYHASLHAARRGKVTT